MAKFHAQRSLIALWVLAGMAAFSVGLTRWYNIFKKAPFYKGFALLASGTIMSQYFILRPKK